MKQKGKRPRERRRNWIKIENNIHIFILFAYLRAIVDGFSLCNISRLLFPSINNIYKVRIAYFDEVYHDITGRFREEMGMNCEICVPFE